MHTDKAAPKHYKYKLQQQAAQEARFGSRPGSDGRRRSKYALQLQQAQQEEEEAEERRQRRRQVCGWGLLPLKVNAMCFYEPLVHDLGFLRCATYAACQSSKLSHLCSRERWCPWATGKMECGHERMHACMCKCVHSASTAM